MPYDIENREGVSGYLKLGAKKRGGGNGTKRRERRSSEEQVGFTWERGPNKGLDGGEETAHEPDIHEPVGTKNEGGRVPKDVDTKKKREETCTTQP